MIITRCAPVALVVALAAFNAVAHCEIPCGIYTDEMRVQMIEEHCKTIEKSMSQISGPRSGPIRHRARLEPGSDLERTTSPTVVVAARHRRLLRGGGGSHSVGSARLGCLSVQVCGGPSRGSARAEET